jgi:hypothetical protein
MERIQVNLSILHTYELYRRLWWLNLVISTVFVVIIGRGWCTQIRLLVRRSGEPPSSTPCQVWCRCPHGARTAFPETPCPSVSPGRPRHRGYAARGDRAMGVLGVPRAAPAGRSDRGLGRADRPCAQHCCYGPNGRADTVRRIFRFSIFLYNSKNCINF